MSQSDVDPAIVLVAERVVASGLGNAVVPLVGHEDSPGYVTGTGTLLRVAGEPFLLSASHVVSDLARRGQGARIPCFGSGRRFVSVAGQGAVATNDRKHDVAVIRLARETADALVEGGWGFIGTGHLETVAPPDLSQGYCLVLGYPQVLSGRAGTKVMFSPQALMCQLASPRDAGVLSSAYDPANHFLLRAREVMTDARTGVIEPRVRVQGMSGGPVWWVGTGDDPRPLDQRAAAARWIGIQSSIFEHTAAGAGFLKVESIELAARLLCREWPEFTAPLALHRIPAVPRAPW